MKRIWIIYLAIIILSLLIISFIFFIPKLYETPEIENNTVLNIIDGDTFEYYDADLDSIKVVRLLCVNTPEISEEGYQEARIFLQNLILGKQVKMEKDVSETDKYNRLLRYVYVNTNETEIFVNKEIVKNGYADIMIIEPDTKRCGEMYN